MEVRGRIRTISSFLPVKRVQSPESSGGHHLSARLAFPDHGKEKKRWKWRKEKERGRERKGGCRAVKLSHHNSTVETKGTK